MKMACTQLLVELTFKIAGKRKGKLKFNDALSVNRLGTQGKLTIARIQSFPLVYARDCRDSFDVATRRC